MLRFNGETSFFTQLVIRHPYRTLARQGGERSGPCRNVRVTELCEVKGDVPFRSRRGSTTKHSLLPIYRPADNWEIRVEEKGSQPDKKTGGSIPPQNIDGRWASIISAVTMTERAPAVVGQRVSHKAVLHEETKAMTVHDWSEIPIAGTVLAGIRRTGLERLMLGVSRREITFSWHPHEKSD